MNRDQAYDIILRIAAAYPQFDLAGRIGEKRIGIWITALVGMSYDQVMNRLKTHITDNKFPPTIAEISASTQVRNGFLDMYKQWESEGMYAKNQKH